MMELTLIVATLLQRFQVTLAPDHGAVGPEALIAMRPKGGVRVSLTRLAHEPGGPPSSVYAAGADLTP